MEKEILERANKGETSQMCGPIGAGLGRIDHTGVTVTSWQSSVFHSWSPRTMGPTLSPETSAFKLQTPGKFPEDYKLHSEHGESLKTSEGHCLDSNSVYQILTGLLISPYPDPSEKTIERASFFVRRGGHCCRGDLVGRTNFWIVFEWLAKVRVWSLWLVSFLVGLRTYQHPGK